MAVNFQLADFRANKKFKNSVSSGTPVHTHKKVSGWKELDGGTSHAHLWVVEFQWTVFFFVCFVTFSRFSTMNMYSFHN